MRVFSPQYGPNEIIFFFYLLFFAVVVGVVFLYKHSVFLRAEEKKQVQRARK